MDADTFDLLSISIDSTTKLVSATSTSNANLHTELSALNALHKSLRTLDTPAAVPPPPVPVNPKRSAAITKLRDSGNTAFRKQSYAEAARLYSLGIDMAQGRPQWEPQGLVREELSALYANRAQVFMAQRMWAEGWVDAQCSVEMKKQGNPKAWWRGGRCLVELTRVQEAKEWVGKALDFGVEHEDGDLVALAKEIDALTEKGE